MPQLGQPRCPEYVAKGVEYSPGRRRIVIEFSQEDFDAIRRKAVLDGTSFAEAVRTLVQWGFEAEGI